MLEFSHFSKTYKGGKRAVDDLSLRVEPGDLFGFIGHNGAGKTTAIRSAVGILDFEEGDILIDGQSIKQNPVECKRNLAYIPDNPEPYTYLTGIQYITFIADMYEVKQERRDELIKKYATAFDIESDLGNFIETYSHGMRQKLSLIAALVHEPRLLILDEPFVGLDPKASHTLKTIMREFCDAGSAIFFSTHVLEVAEKLCNKIAVIKSGKLIACDYIDKVRGNSSLEDIFLELTEQ